MLLAGILLFLGASLAALTFWLKERQPSKPVIAAPSEPASGAEISMSGKLRAQKTVSIPAPIDGTLGAFPVKPGDEVGEGQLLGNILNASLEDARKLAEQDLERWTERRTALESGLITARLEESRAAADASRAHNELQRAQKVYERQSLLWHEGATARRTFESAEADYQARQTEAQTLDEVAHQAQLKIERMSTDLETAKKAGSEREAELDHTLNELKSCEIRSPVDGIIISIEKQAGEPIVKGMPGLINIAVDVSQMEVVLESDPKYEKRIKPGQSALVEVPELPGNGLPATISSVDGGTVVVRFASPSPLIRPGMSALVRLRLT
jgi:multidrug resistance efflux pump